MTIHFRPEQKKVIACIACEHGVPLREVHFRTIQIDGKDHVVRGTARLARLLDEALKKARNG